ncbi:response regulator transcription factor [Candidatus Woesearchaeota archaeon]|nr:response regulator transcription factor [Candidatus Woesearchaeota archaeon]
MTTEAATAPKKKVLIIDDQYPLREFLETMLEDDYDVIKAESAVEARTVLHESVDLIILDIMMPNFDGYAFCKELKSSIVTKHIPIMVLTAKHQLSDLQPAIDAGADEYLTKPLEQEYFMKRVKILVERIKEDDIPPQGKLLQFGGGFHYVRRKNI